MFYKLKLNFMCRYVCPIVADLVTFTELSYPTQKLSFRHTVWHKNFMVVKFYGSPHNHMDKKLLGFLILRKPSYVLDLIVIYTRLVSSLQILIYGSATNHKTIKLNSM